MSDRGGRDAVQFTAVNPCLKDFLVIRIPTVEYCAPSEEPHDGDDPRFSPIPLRNKKVKNATDMDDLPNRQRSTSLCILPSIIKAKNLFVTEIESEWSSDDNKPSKNVSTSWSPTPNLKSQGIFGKETFKLKAKKKEVNGLAKMFPPAKHRFPRIKELQENVEKTEDFQDMYNYIHEIVNNESVEVEYVSPRAKKSGIKIPEFVIVNKFEKELPVRIREKIDRTRNNQSAIEITSKKKKRAKHRRSTSKNDVTVEEKKDLHE